MLPLAGVFVSACGLLIGIDPDLDVRPADAGTDAPDTAVVVVEAGKDTSIDVEAGPSPPRRPPEGTYVYEISGTEDLTTQPQRVYGPTTSVTIAYDSDGGAECYSMTFNLRTDYVETNHLCIRGLDVTMDRGTRDQTFPIGRTLTTLSCVPGDIYFSTVASPSVQTHKCDGDNDENNTNSKSKFRTMGPYSYVAPDVTAKVMGKDVVVRHFHDERLVTSLSNSQSGTNVAEWSFSAEDGTLQLFERRVDITYHVGPLNFRYVEKLNMSLSQLPGASDASTD
jgi:hypothetical protein